MTSNGPSASVNDALYRPKRFWKVAEARLDAGGAAAVLLDGRTAKTPAGKPLVVPTLALAQMIAAEWEAVTDFVEVGDMPATRLAFTTLDRVSEAKDAVAAEVARYAGSDLLCYFADEPASLLERQARLWGELLDWAEQDLDLRFVRASGVIHQAQPQATLEKVRALASDLDEFSLSGLSWATALFGSAVLALAVQRGRLGGEQAFDLSRLDENYQAEQWGVDAEAAEREARLRSEALVLDRWFAALRP